MSKSRFARRFEQKMKDKNLRARAFKPKDDGEVLLEKLRGHLHDQLSVHESYRKKNDSPVGKATSFGAETAIEDALWQIDSLFLVGDLDTEDEEESE